MAGFLLLLLVLVPAPYFGGSSHTASFIMNVLAAAACCLRIFSADFLDGDASGRLWKAVRTPSVLFMVFMLYVGIQWAGGQHVFSKVAPGSVYAYETARNGAQLLFYFLFFILCVDFFSTEQRVRLLTVLIGLEITVLVACAYYWRVNRMVAGTFSHPDPLGFFAANSNRFGSILVAVTPLFLSAVAQNHQNLRQKFHLDIPLLESIFYVFLLVCVSAAVLHVQARAAFATQIFTVIFFWAAVPGIPWRLRVVYSASLAAAVAVTLFLAGSSNLTVDTWSTLAEEWRHRLAVARDSLSIFRDFPLFGTGFGTYAWIARAYQTTRPELEFYRNNYNAYLELLTDAGAVGFLILIAVPLYLVFQCARKLIPEFPKKDLSGEVSWASIQGFASLLAIAALAVLSLVDNVPKTPATSLFVVLHLALFTRCAVSAGGPLPSGVLNRNRPSKRRWLAAVVALSLVFFIVQRHRDFKAQLILNRNGSLLFHGLSQQETPPDRKGLETCVTLEASNAEAWAMLGRAYYETMLRSRGAEQRPMLEKSIRAYRRAVQLAPTWPDTWFYLGAMEILNRQRSQGLRDMARAVELLPYNRDAYLYLISNYLRNADETPWPAERQAFRELAFDWFRKAQTLDKPFSLKDYDYIYNYDYTRRQPRQLDEKDKERFLSLLSRHLQTP